jgi:biopolymer transport protein ExbD
MKKYSKSAHHSLNELNITPLLDLAFVLLVIFIITTTPVVNDLELNLPSASNHPKPQEKKLNYVTVVANGDIYLNMARIDISALQPALAQLRETDPDLNVVVRGDSAVPYQKMVTVVDALQQANITKVGLATDAVSGIKPK